MNPPEMLDKTRSLSTVMMKFHKNFGQNKDNADYYYCFFEGGEDPSFYYSFIQDKIEYQPFVCNCKSNVLQAYDMLKRGYENLAFFVDRDFDKSIGNPKIFETDYYAIENYLCGERFLKNLLKNEFLISVAENEFLDVVALYKTKIVEFHKAIKDFNLWYYWVKTLPDAIKRTVSLDDLKISDLVNIDFDCEISAKYTIATLNAKYPDVGAVFDEKQMRSAVSGFSRKTPYKCYRGKYEIAFMKKLVRFLIEDANNTKKRKYIKRKTTVSFQEDAFVKVFSKYGEKPAGLDAYIDSLKK